VVAAALARIPGAGAQTGSVNLSDLSAACGSVGTSAQVVVPAVNATIAGGACANMLSDRATIFLSNASASATVSCGYSNAVTINGQGTFTLPPGWTARYSRGDAVKVAIWCIASAPSTPMGVTVGN
jgi:hypothetical protein